MGKIQNSIYAINNVWGLKSLRGYATERVFGSNLPIGDNVIYTVPAGKKGLFGILSYIYNSSSGNIDCYQTIYKNGTYIPVSALTTVSTNSFSSLVMNLPIILNAGEKFAVNVATNNGLNLENEIILFDEDEPLNTVIFTSIINGNNTIYTCPSGKTAMLGNNFYFSSGFVSICNYSGSSVNYTPYFVPSGGSVGSNTQVGSTTTINDKARSDLYFPANLLEGDSIVINANNNASGQVMLLTYWEV